MKSRRYSFIICALVLVLVIRSWWPAPRIDFLPEMSDKQFTQLYVQYARDQGSDMRTSMIAPLQVETIMYKYRSIGDIKNIYVLYLNGPHTQQAAEALFKDYRDRLKQFLQRKHDAPPPAITQYFPTLMNTKYFESLPLHEDLIHETFNSETVIVYGVDSGTGMDYITSKMLREDCKISEEQMKNYAFQNANAALADVKISEKPELPGVYFLSYDHNYRMFIPLTSYIPEHFKDKVDGELIIGLPSLDEVIITGSNNSKGVEYIRKENPTGKRYYEKDVLVNDINLATQPFVYRNGKYEDY